MKKYFVLLLIVFIAIYHIKAQEIDTVCIKKYGDIADSTSYAFYRLYSRIGDIYKVTDYYKNGKIQMTGSYKDSDFVTPTGPFFYYTRRNRIKCAEVYEPHLYPYVQANINKSGSLVSTDTDSLILVCHYHRNGKVKSIGYVSDSFAAEGVWLNFDKKGRILYTLTYKNSQADGEYVFYNTNGIPYIKGNFKNGKKEGEFKIFSYEGNPAKTIYYSEGKRTAVKR